MSAAASLALLRQDVRLVPGPNEPAGAPTWQLVDPLRHQYFRLGWLEFECLSRWRLGDPERIAAAVRSETTLAAHADDVVALNRFLQLQQLVQLRERPRAPALPAWQKHYMKLVYHRLPLLHPQPMLDRLLPQTDWLWQPHWRAIVAVLAVLALWLLGMRASDIAADLGRYANQQGLLLGLLVLAVTKTLHEIGHGIACRRHGCRVPAMGIAFVFLWPMPYVDTSDTWRLLDRRKRLEVALAGVTTEMLLAIVASFAWLYLQPSALRDVCLFVAVLSWALSLLVNLNPLMRFDGYYALVDATGLDNLQTRSFALLRWQILRWFGRDEPMPEHASRTTARWLLWYGAASVVYRLSIYIAVSALVSTLLPSSIAWPLLAAGWYLLVLRPVQRDAAHVLLRSDDAPGRSPSDAPRRQRFRWPRGRARIVLAAAAVLLAYVVVPLPRTLNVPAVRSSNVVHSLHVSEAALWTGWRVRHGERVRRGQLLATLQSPELDTEIARQQLTLASLELRYATRGASGQADRTSAEDVRSARGQLEALVARRQRLSLYAPADGTLYIDAQDLARPRWLAADTRLGTLVGGGSVVQAYLDPTQRQQLDPDAAPTFYPSDCAPSCAPIATRVLAHDELASKLAVAPRLAAFAGARNHDVYRLLLATSAPPLPREQLGTVRMRTRATSPLFDVLRRGLGVVRREVGV